jgi:hypothetical protein
MKRGGDFDFDSAQLNAWVEAAAASGRFAEKEAEALRENPIFHVLIGRLARRGRRLDAGSRLAPIREDFFAELLLETLAQPQEMIEGIGAYLLLRADDFDNPAGEGNSFRSGWQEWFGWFCWMAVFLSPGALFFATAWKERALYPESNFFFALYGVLFPLGMLWWYFWASGVAQKRMALSSLRRVRPILATKRSFGAASIHGADSLGLGCMEIIIGAFFFGVSLFLGYLLGAMASYMDSLAGWNAGALCASFVFVGSFNVQLKHDSAGEQNLLKDFLKAWRKEERQSRAQGA